MFVLFLNDYYKHTIMNIKKSYIYLSIALSFLGISACSESDKHTGFLDDNQELLVGLTEVDGYDHTYNYDFNILKEREKVEFYIPTSLSEGLNRIPSEMRSKINLISSTDLPFIVANNQSNIVTSWNNYNKLVFQIQISYLENDLGYDTNFKDFFIVSITQCPDNPFEKMDEEALKTLNDDLELRKYEFLNLKEDLTLYYLPKSNDNSWPRMFDYYNYNENEKRMYKESTGSYQYYAWYNGLIFKIGCNMDMDAVDPEPLVRKIILGN